MSARRCGVVLTLLLSAVPAWSGEHDKGAALGAQLSTQSLLVGAQLTFECTPDCLFFRHKPIVHPRPRKPFAFVFDASYHTGEHEGLTRDQYLLMAGGRYAWETMPYHPGTSAVTNHLSLFTQVLVGAGWSVDHDPTGPRRVSEKARPAVGLAAGGDITLKDWVGLRLQAGVTFVDNLKPIPRFGIAIVIREDE
jgi:hypothetical protein